MKDERGSQRGAGSTDRGRRGVARAATLRVIERHGPQVMRTARRYAATVEDAEDAYQRGIEIMLTKAPDIPDAELLPWLKTVVRHEAFALRRKHGRIALGTGGDADGEDEFVSLAPTPGEQAERLERLRLGAEALNGLKPQEARALALLAEGYSYRQICEKTGWTYTKVNRCLAEGRQKFVQRVAGIESGAECDRLAPKLSAVADGEAGPADVALLRRHLRDCLACRATLREHQLAPAVVGALLPLPLLERASWPIDRLADIATTLRFKVESLVRFGSVDAASSPTQLALSGGTRGIASTGLAKVLALVCVGGAGVGGAAAVEEVLGPDGPPSARAATQGADESEPLGTANPKSPDARLVAERLGTPDDRRSDQSTNRSGKARPSDTDKANAAESGPEGGPATPRSTHQHRESPEPVPPSRPLNPPAADDHENPEGSTPPKSDSSCSESRAPAGQYGNGGSGGRHPGDEYETISGGRRPGDEYKPISGGCHPDDQYEPISADRHPSDEYETIPGGRQPGDQ